MRTIAWLTLGLLALVSVVFFARYLMISAALGDPQIARVLRAIAVFVVLGPTVARETLASAQTAPARADFALYLSLATALSAVVLFALLVATRRRAPDDDSADAPDDDTGVMVVSQTCPACSEPIRGAEMVCQCGYHFGPKAWP